MPSATPCIALLTDFGDQDWFVAAMKGEILKRLPQANVIDISHGLPAHQIEPASFMVCCVLGAMPEGTVFCCVVDPEVGSRRRSLCGRVGRWFFSGPDNGLVSSLIDVVGEDFELHEIENPAFRNERISPTFHGRDLFAPAAAALASGRGPAEAGPAVNEPVRLPPCEPAATDSGIVARVMLVDRFGNLVTNVWEESYHDRLLPDRFVIRVGSMRLYNLSETFSQVREVEALAYWGSAGTLELAVNLGSAAQTTGLGIGDQVFVDWLDGKLGVP